ncbi:MULTISPECIES: flagellar biosynthetic protein FliR [unclassified Burkholderia]|uniref:flagellar biosynthetic protein FliR n=1 Tax=unclassified Burkholderia TaxID=2613784 RepID=UPI00075C1BC2|nr:MULTISPECIES: flagellar biosynthetic protein FliR [unclassified Burkholderia]KUY99820.1 flagellar biosynthetic protein FliR [Burkholderia sp. RF7-non_BP1]KUZ03955.1 flagellar biosynthetic protein FliR [Burkholderia sp. RF7-non_BP4]
MDALLAAAPDGLARIWWPFCRILAALSTAPFAGDNAVPMRMRTMIALLLATIALPVAGDAGVRVFSAQGALLCAEQILIGFLFGAAFHFVHSVFLLLGYLVSTQMGLAMAVMNDPLNGATSDVVSGLMLVASILLFFSIDAHLIVVQVLYASFRVWPVGQPIDMVSLRPIVFQVGWVLSTTTLLAAPLVFATIVLQIGKSYLSRATPSINLFSVGFALTTLFGMLMLGGVVTGLPGDYLKMTAHVLDVLERHLGAGRG